MAGGLRVEDATDVHLHHIEVTWSEPESTDNGAYGLYPVLSRNVLMEFCEASNASDAGIYLGQSQNAIVRNNVARGNVAGIEIENSQAAHHQLDQMEASFRPVPQGEVQAGFLRSLLKTDLRRQTPGN